MAYLPIGSSEASKGYLRISQDNLDAFERVRSSSPTLVFDSRLLYDNQALFWDDAVISGAGTSSTYNTNQASVTLAVSNTTAGFRARQTFERFAYQPGHSTLVIMTGILGTPATGITRRLGQFDSQNGLFFESNATVVAVGRRTYVTGSAVDTLVTQANWNVDKLNGTGVSGINIDFSKTQIFVISYQWLGVGTVTFGLDVNGIFYPCHRMHHANSLTTVYMSNATLPLRYEVANDGTGGVAGITQICCSVVSEGGAADPGHTRCLDRTSAFTTLNNASYYPVMAFRHQSGREMINFTLDRIDIFCPSTSVYNFRLILNPTVTGTALSFTTLANSAIEYDIATTNASTVTGGTVLYGGIGDSNSIVTLSPKAGSLRLGSSIGGTRDIIVLAVSRITGGAEAFYASAVWREF